MISPAQYTTGPLSKDQVQFNCPSGELIDVCAKHSSISLSVPEQQRDKLKKVLAGMFDGDTLQITWQEGFRRRLVSFAFSSADT